MERFPEVQVDLLCADRVVDLVQTQPSDLEALDCVVFGAGPDRTHWTLVRGYETATVTIRPRLVVNDFEFLEAAARTGVGVTLHPAHAAARGVPEHAPPLARDPGLPRTCATADDAAAMGARPDAVITHCRTRVSSCGEIPSHTSATLGSA
jgi:DNA-binding transcriptional LysR family regulator